MEQNGVEILEVQVRDKRNTSGDGYLSFKEL